MTALHGISRILFLIPSGLYTRWAPASCLVLTMFDVWPGGRRDACDDTCNAQSVAIEKPIATSGGLLQCPALLNANATGCLRTRFWHQTPGLRRDRCKVSLASEPCSKRSSVYGEVLMWTILCGIQRQRTQHAKRKTRANQRCSQLWKRQAKDTS